MFDNIKRWIIRGIDKMLSKSTIEDALKIRTAISDEMDNAMKLWLQIFTNNAPWINKEISSQEIGASISEEFARLTTLEMKFNVSGSKRADFINKQLEEILKILKTKVALFDAVGGGFFKPYVKDNKFYIDYIPQTDCKPIAFNDAGGITSIVFSSQVTKGDVIYTRLEIHTLQENKYIVENKVYRTELNNPSVLGRPASLSDVLEWSNLSEREVIENVEKPLFSYYKVPLTNNIDPKSCLGVSVYNKATDNIKKLDIQEARLDYEYDSAERSIYADVNALKNKDGTARRQKIIKTIDSDEDNFYKEFSPSIRDENFIRGSNKIKQNIEFQCHLSYGTISDPSMIEKTATEIEASKQRSYSTVSQMQRSLEDALKHLVYILDVYCDLYELAPSGKYEISSDWDDSIIEDKSSKKVIDMQEVSAGLKSKKRYLMENYGMSETEAQKELDDIANEKKNSTVFNEYNLNNNEDGEE